MRIAICDDSEQCAAELVALISAAEPEAEITRFENGEAIAAAYAAEPGRFDAVFMDVEMGGMSGIETANFIRQADAYVHIVFVTAHESYAVECFECRPFRFLVKPVREAAFGQVYHALCKSLQEQPETLVFTENKNKIRIFSADILFFESRLHYVLVYKRNGDVHKIRTTLGQLEAEIDMCRFCRIHRSFIVHLDCIYKIAETAVYLHEYDSPLPLSKTYRTAFSETFMKYEERRFYI